MKKIITIVAAMMLVFAVGSVLADEMPIMMENRDVGILLNTEAPGKVISSPARDFGHAPVSEALVDVGTAIYISAFETKLAEGVSGVAAGGVARDDENTRIWDNLLVPTGEKLE